MKTNKLESPEYYKEDILDQLLHVNSTPLQHMRQGLEAIDQTIVRAVDEIEKLRAENRELQENCKRLRKGLYRDN